jgi:hypothetical protein
LSTVAVWAVGQRRTLHQGLRMDWASNGLVFWLEFWVSCFAKLLPVIHCFRTASGLCSDAEEGIVGGVACGCGAVEG